MSERRVAILTSGGDAPGMNAAIRAATMVARERGWAVLGVENGYQGLIEGLVRSLDVADVADLVREGGTFLGSARSAEFQTVAGRTEARARLAGARVDALIVIGGNGSLTGALALTEPAEAGDAALSVIGVPASIDNDVGITSLSIGVDTAMNTIVEACDRIADTASAHDRTFIVEVMGRDCGYLAMATSVAVGAEVVLFRESGKSPETVVDEVTQAILTARRRTGRGRRVLVIKSEGVRLTAEALKQAVDAQLGALGGDAARVETRVTVLGHLVRGGRPSAFDRLMASRMGNAAVRALAEGATRQMVAWNPPSIVTPPDAQRSPVDPRCTLVRLDAMLEETARMHDGTSPVVAWRLRAFDELENVLRV